MDAKIQAYIDSLEGDMSMSFEDLLKDREFKGLSRPDRITFLLNYSATKAEIIETVDELIQLCEEDPEYLHTILSELPPVAVYDIITSLISNKVK